jgi:hypothetical protein
VLASYSIHPITMERSYLSTEDALATMEIHRTPSSFMFYEDPSSVEGESDVLAAIPPGLRGKPALFSALELALCLPSYFGHNWDALDECLRDFHWLEQRRIVIVHNDLPDLSPRDSRIYLDLMADAVDDWQHDEHHVLVVAFPQALEQEISRIMQSC